MKRVHQWESEPDSLDWLWEDYRCALRRNFSKVWCGYVGVPVYHPMYGLDYNTPCRALEKRLEGLKDRPIGRDGMYMSRMIAALGGSIEATPAIVLDCHGGITFAGSRAEVANETRDLWYFGFDCGHCDDLSPYMLEEYPDLYRGELRSCVYRTMEYAKSHVEMLAGQLKEIEMAVKGEQL